LLLTRLALIVQPILERYYLAFIVIWQSAESPMTETELEQHCHLLAQKISMVYGINSPDFFDRQLFRHFIETALDLDYLEKMIRCPWFLPDLSSSLTWTFVIF